MKSVVNIQEIEMQLWNSEYFYQLKNILRNTVG